MDKSPRSGRIGIELSRDYFTFSAAHFAQLEDGTSEALHGHNFAITVRVERETSANGYVVDFSHVKSAVLSITRALNHRVLLPRDATRVLISTSANEIEVNADGNRYVFPASDVALLPVKNTTCEELASYVGTSLVPCLPKARISVKIEESPAQGAYWISTDASC